MRSHEPQAAANWPVTQPESLPVSTQAAPPRSRLFFVDHLRVALTCLVIIHHLAVTYGAGAIWYYVELPQDGVFRHQKESGPRA